MANDTTYLDFIEPSLPKTQAKRRSHAGNNSVATIETYRSTARMTTDRSEGNLLSKNLKVRIYKTVISSVVLYGYETWTLTLREEHRLRVFENKVRRKIFWAKRDEVTGEWRKLHNTELYALYSSPDIIRNIKSRRLRWARHVGRMGESRNAYRVLVGRPEEKRPLGRPRRRWEDNIKMDLREDHLVEAYLLPNSLHGSNYFVFLRDVLPELLENISLNIRERIWFQHDGAPPHLDRRVRNHLNATLPDRWIGSDGSVPWPPRSPDPTPLDFFLWGDVKRFLYEAPTDTAKDLVAPVVEAAHVIRDNVGFFERCTLHSTKVPVVQCLQWTEV
ncbi:hypothetical protein ANN_19627 [Periplaneta americana]|uniref:Transposable element Tc3 transposase n=1 Tax=Periplaneta americana TaxID=6978 RepID=A0ABQ8SAE9_PERAM|nr:hypothetical protein ANN_19627 [Periplaneta americana]